MDQLKIGRFIAAERKRQGLTQRQLAEQLSISDKTISKWECGKGLPEVSLGVWQGPAGGLADAAAV